MKPPLVVIPSKRRDLRFLGTENGINRRRRY